MDQFVTMDRAAAGVDFGNFDCCCYSEGVFRHGAACCLQGAVYFLLFTFFLFHSIVIVA